MTGTHASPRERLYRRTELTDPPILVDRIGRPIVGRCLVWLGSSDAAGYGSIKGAGKVVKTHRLAYALEFKIEYSDVPELDHLCRNRACLQLAHLEPVSHVENILRGDTGLHNRLKPYCPAGHEYDEVNTYVNNGRRVCRICTREAGRRYEAAHPERTKRKKRTK